MRVPCLAKDVNSDTGEVITPVSDDTVTGLLIRDFPDNGVFGYGKESGASDSGDLAGAR